MRERNLGRTGWPVSVIGYGAWQIGGTQWGAVDERRAKDALRAALESGVTFFDTALAYGDGRSERLVGEVIREERARDRVIIATKVPPLNRKWPARPEHALRDVYPREWIRECAERSLRHLDAGPIDLLQLHTWTDAWADEDEWYDEMRALVDEGKVRAIGVSLSENDPASGLAVTRSGRVDAIQVIYNVFDQTPAAELFPAAQEKNVGVIVRVPLDEGALGGTFTLQTTFPPSDFRARYFRGERLREVVERVERMRPLLEAPGQSFAQGALRFAFSHPAVSTVIVGSTNPAHVRENARAGEFAPLDAATLEALREHAWARSFYH